MRVLADDLAQRIDPITTGTGDQVIPVAFYCVQFVKSQLYAG